MTEDDVRRIVREELATYSDAVARRLRDDPLESIRAGHSYAKRMYGTITVEDKD